MTRKKNYYFNKGTCNFYFSLDKKVDQITKWIRLGNSKLGFCKLRGFVHKQPNTTFQKMAFEAYYTVHTSA